MIFRWESCGNANRDLASHAIYGTALMGISPAQWHAVPILSGPLAASKYNTHWIKGKQKNLIGLDADFSNLCPFSGPVCTDKLNNWALFWMTWLDPIPYTLFVDMLDDEGKRRWMERKQKKERPVEEIPRLYPTVVMICYCLWADNLHLYKRSSVLCM